MSNVPLAAKYRPQIFAEVAGQDTLKSILSRASKENKVAPAYLFSGTRGVGKTTLARIFAKALNCRNAPVGEPCNNCDQCRAVTMGSAVDVLEIDGASNRGIDDIRRLKEVVGYAPMEGRYKIFIIDEAHMLSREAFNALLKTLEEPPANVTFIMATTEPHKFPATIISRCQHYVFKRLPEDGLIRHLTNILAQENVLFEENAVRLIAKRGAGSVRDSMSLLGQVLALGSGELTEETTRGVLGLAGQEALIRMGEALAEGQTLAITRSLQELLDQGLDIGFFLRELAGLWRNLFILRQSGEEGLSAIDAPDAQKALLLNLSSLFSLSHIHACWQMTLEGQRRVLTSMEPSLALELLLLNLAMLPKLLSLDGLSAMARRGTAPCPKTAIAREGRAPAKQVATSDAVRPSPKPMAHELKTSTNSQSVSKPASPPPWEEAPGQSMPSSVLADQLEKEKAHEEKNTELMPSVSSERKETHIAPQLNETISSSKLSNSSLGTPSSFDSDAVAKDVTYGQTTSKEKSEINPSHTQGSDEKEALFEKSNTYDTPPEQNVNEEEHVDAVASVAVKAMPATERVEQKTDQLDHSANIQEEDTVAQPSMDQATSPPLHSRPEWNDVINWCVEHDAPTWFMPLIKKITAVWQGEKLMLQPKDAFSGQRILEAGAKKWLDSALLEVCGYLPEITLLEPVDKPEDRAVIKEKVYAHPAVKVLEDSFEARVIDFGKIY